MKFPLVALLFFEAACGELSFRLYVVHHFGFSHVGWPRGMSLWEREEPA